MHIKTLLLEKNNDFWTIVRKNWETSHFDNICGQGQIMAMANKLWLGLGN